MTTATGDTLQMNYDVLRRLSSVRSGMYNYYEDISDRATIRQPSLLFATLLHYSYKNSERGVPMIGSQIARLRQERGM
jgi:hypothetical protein